MQLARGLEYGIEGILSPIQVQRNYGESPLVRQISWASSIPGTVLAKIFQKLSSKGTLADTQEVAS
jgi:DNA-binding IscR family transcriptional regulator